jgi:hypothetical protein
MVSSLLVLGTVAVIGLTAPDHWNGMYLIWGIGIGLAAAANQPLLFYVLPKMVGAISVPSEDQLRRLNFRKKFNMMESMMVGIATGALSAIFDNVAFLLFGIIVLVLASVSPYILMPTMLKRARKRRAG